MNRQHSSSSVLSALRNKIIHQLLPKEQQRDRCLRCNRSRATCFCGFVTPFDTRTRFVILMHPKEFKFQTVGTGRMTGLALRNSETIVGLDFTRDPRLTALLADPRWHSVMLFPGPGSIDLSMNVPFELPAGKTLRVLVIDGTWAMAKKIIRLSPNLQALPKIRFTPPALSRFHIKRQPAAHCVSTIEAVHYLLDILERRGFERLEGRHASLLGAIDALVDFQKKFVAVAPKKPRRS
ncbi:MAG: tRNA-uridine aminocarboxypropyltransferase [Fibrobacterota bacterium]